MIVPSADVSVLVRESASEKSFALREESNHAVYSAPEPKRQTNPNDGTATLVTLDSIDTLNGSLIAVDGTILNGTVNVIVVDIRAKNGLVHLIDAVLLPPA